MGTPEITKAIAETNNKYNHFGKKEATTFWYEGLSGCMVKYFGSDAERVFRDKGVDYLFDLIRELTQHVKDIGAGHLLEQVKD